MDPSPKSNVARECSSGPGAGAARWLAARARALLPQVCALCGEPGGDVVCPRCACALPRAAAHCPVCALPDADGAPCGACRGGARAYERTVVAFRYGYPVDRLVQALKYRGRLALAPFFAAAIAGSIGVPCGADVVVPVPLAPRRLRERGFNQALEIARSLSRLCGVRLERGMVARCRDTPAQAALAGAERLENVRGAFRVAGAARGVRIAVVDDVMTTGATLAEIARVLKEAGAARVENWVAARAAGA